MSTGSWKKAFITRRNIGNEQEQQQYMTIEVSGRSLLHHGELESKRKIHNEYG